ncbi:TolC family protein [Pseudomonas sp. KNUC1026]|uniref:TolC family protein n=1 Tax=Pseudomonas sp. KNUC1026 TaxID=2893890 RepID=UPI001F2D3ADC|nr:TolC family protein [Pseudomonas sp. KNUC1026]UFH50884.1 TolC family protein [Pseudomonas sp. KNUC1026]
MKRTLAGLALLTLAGCTVGPDYHGAPAVAPATLQAGRLPHAPEQGSSAPAAARWWEALGDAQLDRLVEQALAHSPDLAQARARVRQARASLAGQQAEQMPTVSANAMMLRTRSPDTSAFGLGGGGRGPLSLYLAGFDASWEADLFGGTRRAVQAADANAEASAAQLADAQVQLAAEVVQAYVGLRDQQARLALVDATAQVQNQALELTRQRLTRGVASQVQLEQVLTQARTTEAQRLPLQSQAVESLDELALLCGLEPGQLDTPLAAAVPLPQVPAERASGRPGRNCSRRARISAPPSAAWPCAAHRSASSRRSGSPR